MNRSDLYYLVCRVTHLLILHSTKHKHKHLLVYYYRFALSLVEGITDAPPKAFVLLVPYSRQVNPCFTPKKRRFLQPKCKASTTLGVNTRNEGYEQTTMPRVYPERSVSPPRCSDSRSHALIIPAAYAATWIA